MGEESDLSLVDNGIDNMCTSLGLAIPAGGHIPRKWNDPDRTEGREAALAIR